MWLLSTDRAELHYFPRNFDATGGYAILSHTWDKVEQTFQEVQAIAKECRSNGTNPRDFVDKKIRNCCLVAEKDGYRWVWIDSCCIDKTSSSELSEAINSMYRWYTEAEVCYAYLADVPGNCVLNSPDSAFRTSRWHTRGWTLQELIAPDVVIFLSENWSELGSKAELADLLQEITCIQSPVLTRELRPADFSIAIRMSWASKRNTTRVEDEAYCLMGLFGVRMPVNYGEGNRAFIRLQYEIMRHDSDMSLFMFGYLVSQGDNNLAFYGDDQFDHPWQYLMANSPHEFEYGFQYTPDLGLNAWQPYPPLDSPEEADSPRSGHDYGFGYTLDLTSRTNVIRMQQHPSPRDSKVMGPFDNVELPSATVTSYGIQFRLPIYEDDGITIAITLCQANGRHYGLFLKRDNTGKDPKRPRYFTGCVYERLESTTGSAATYVARLVDLGDDLNNLKFGNKPVRASWRTVHIVPTASDLDWSTVPTLIRVNCGPANVTIFRIPRWLMALFTALQFETSQVRNTEELQAIRMLHRSKARIFVSFGSCTRRRPGNNPSTIADSSLPKLWAKVDVISLIDLDVFTHDCDEHHLDSVPWATRSKVFGDQSDRKVRLSFLPSTRRPESESYIHLELLGGTFEEMLREASISIPSFDNLKK